MHNAPMQIGQEYEKPLAHGSAAVLKQHLEFSALQGELLGDSATGTKHAKTSCRHHEKGRTDKSAEDSGALLAKIERLAG